jgi:DNA phosphorothioation-associated putative methyltransferase
MDQIEQPDIRREKTAIVRFRHSKPVTLALSHGVITTETSVFDYGCGRGEDVKYLQAVNLGYVLNVIEDPQEREETLRKAFDLAKRVLVVAVRVDHSLDAGVEFSDGLLTSRGSFQKLYSQSEFRDYVAQVLGRRPHMAGLGVAYVFRDELVESSYLVSLAQKRVETSREQAIEQFTQDAAAKRYLELSAALGRAPIASEFSDYPDLQERFGSLGRIDRLARHALSVEAIEESRRRRREDILT